MEVNKKEPEKKENRKKFPKRANKTFRVHTKYTEDFPIFEKPRITGYWSIDGTRKQHLDCSQLRYYYARDGNNLSIDLKEGLEQVVRRPDNLDHEKIDHLLRWIEANYKKILANPDSPRW